MARLAPPGYTLSLSLPPPQPQHPHPQLQPPQHNIHVRLLFMERLREKELSAVDPMKDNTAISPLAPPSASTRTTSPPTNYNTPQPQPQPQPPQLQTTHRSDIACLPTTAPSHLFISATSRHFKSLRRTARAKGMLFSGPICVLIQK